MGKRIDLTGKTINGVYVRDFAYVGGGKSQKAYWNCTCSCGNEFIAESYKLRTGYTRSCGCLRAETLRKRATTHGTTAGGQKNRLYFIWKSMRMRCNCQSDKAYKNYGGRGIKVCDEWNDYLVFKSWSLNNGYSDDLTIERININKGYSPDNCKWIPLKDQCLNKQNTIWVVYKGQRKPLKVWCGELGLKYEKITQRLKPLGWSVERAFETP